eukprot:6941704-Pyramimonas_sp.AAC.2
MLPTSQKNAHSFVCNPFYTNRSGGGMSPFRRNEEGDLPDRGGLKGTRPRAQVAAGWTCLRASLRGNAVPSTPRSSSQT